MRFETVAFYIQKLGNSASEYEDAYRLPRKPSNSGPWRVSIADGATETSFAGLWAQLLTREFVKGALDVDDDALENALARTARIWRRIVQQRSLPWYAEQKLELGAYSSFIGVTLELSEDGRGGTWRALAIGDSCLFHLRNSCVLKAFPIAESAAFTSRPQLIGSCNDDLDASVAREVGQFAVGDRFYLMTDALACWFLRLEEQKMSAADRLRDIANQEAFEELIRQERQRVDREGIPVLRNDDVTLVSWTMQLSSQALVVI